MSSIIYVSGTHEVLFIPFPWIWKVVSATLWSGKYTLSYPRGRYIYTPSGGCGGGGCWRLRWWCLIYQFARDLSSPRLISNNRSMNKSTTAFTTDLLLTLHELIFVYRSTLEYGGGGETLGQQWASVENAAPLLARRLLFVPADECPCIAVCLCVATLQFIDLK